MSEWIPYKDGDDIIWSDLYWIVVADALIVMGEKVYLKANRWGFRTDNGIVDDVTHYMPINKPDLPRAR